MAAKTEHPPIPTWNELAAEAAAAERWAAASAYYELVSTVATLVGASALSYSDLELATAVAADVAPSQM